MLFGSILVIAKQVDLDIYLNTFVIAIRLLTEN